MSTPRDRRAGHVSSPDHGWRRNANLLRGAARVLSRLRNADPLVGLGHQDRGVAAVSRVECEAAGGRERRLGRHHQLQRACRCRAEGLRRREHGHRALHGGRQLCARASREVHRLLVRSEHETTVRRSRSSHVSTDRARLSYFNGCPPEAAGGSWKRRAIRRLRRIVAGAAANPGTDVASGWLRPCTSPRRASCRRAPRDSRRRGRKG